MSVEIVEIDKKEDKRGSLVQFLTQPELIEKRFGTAFFIYIAPKKDRSCHFHKRKKEWFGIVHGKCNVILEDIKTKKRQELVLDSSSVKFVRIKVCPLIAHHIENLLDDISILIGYMDEPYDPNDPDTYYYKFKK